MWLASRNQCVDAISKSSDPDVRKNPEGSIVMRKLHEKQKKRYATKSISYLHRNGLQSYFVYFVSGSLFNLVTGSMSDATK